MCKVKTEDKATFYSFVEAKVVRDTWVRMDSGASMHNPEQRRIKFRNNGYFEKVQKLHVRLTATRSSANQRVSTSFCSWSRSVRNKAITRWNVSDSIASSALLKTRILIWVENDETPQLTKNGKTITCTMDNSVLLVVSRLSSISSSSLFSISRSSDQCN